MNESSIKEKLMNVTNLLQEEVDKFWRQTRISKLRSEQLKLTKMLRKTKAKQNIWLRFEE